MAYRRKFRRSRGRIAGRVARKTYKGTRRMSRNRIRRVYATKVGQVAWRVAGMRRRRGSYRRRPIRRYGRRFKRRY